MKYIFDKFEPWQHQRQALEASWNKPYYALLLSYGCGKTYVILHTCGLLYEIKKDIDALFVIAPNEVHRQWVDEQAPLHLPERIPYISRVWSTSTSKSYKKSLEELWEPKHKGKLKVFSMNVESLQSSTRAQAFAQNFLKSFRSLLVLDESTRVKNITSKRSKFIINKLAPLAPYRRILTGEPVTRSPFDVYAQFLFLHKDFWHPIPNYHVFKHRYGEWRQNFTFRKQISVKNHKCKECASYTNSINIKRANGAVFAICPNCNMVMKKQGLPAKVKKLLDNDGKFEYPTLLKYKNLEELRERTKQCSILIKKEDCMDLPEKIYAPIYTEMNDEQKRLYTELKTRMYTEYNGEELTVANKVALTTRFQQIVGGFFPETEEQIGPNNPKIDRLLNELEDINTDDPIIIWARFTAEIKGIAKALKKTYPDKKTVTFFGETSREDRKQYIQDFKDGKIDYFVANPAVAGTGLNLQRSHIHFYYSNDFNAETRWQSEARSFRGGQTKNCIFKDIFIKGSVDDSIKEANEKKMSLAKFFKERPLEEIV